MRRGLLGKLVILLLHTAYLLIAPAPKVFGQNLGETRTLVLGYGELADVLTELFAAAGVTDERGVRDVLALVNSLEMGDQVQLRFGTSHPGDAGELFVNLRRDLYVWTGVRSAGTALDSATAVFRRRAIAMLFPMNNGIVINLQDGPVVDGHSRPSLILETAQSYACTHHRIEADIIENSGNIQFNILGIMPPRGLCGPAPTPAFITRPTSVTPGSYELNIVHDQRSDRYRLVVSDSSIRLIAIHASFSQADTLEHWRRPHRSFHVGCHEASPWCAAFRKWLAARPDIRVRQFPNYGMPPYSASAPGAAYYVYETEESRIAVEACLKHLGDIAPAGLVIMIENWDGRRSEAVSRAADPEIPAAPPPFPAECMK